MINSIFRKKFLLVEFLTIILAFFWGVAGNYVIPNYSNSELVLTVVFIVLFLQILLYRSSHPRHLWIAFGLIVTTSLVNAITLERATYFLSSLAFVVLFVGVLNLILFISIDKKPVHAIETAPSHKKNRKKEKALKNV